MGSRISRRLSRLRHFRGHGVHSPYIYNIVREVFTSRGRVVTNSAVYSLLTSHGIKKNQALQIENIVAICNYRHVLVIDAFSDSQLQEGDFDCIICTRKYNNEDIERITDYAAERGVTVIVMSPYITKLRKETCRKIVECHTCTSLDKYYYLIIFNNHLPKQHFCI